MALMFAKLEVDVLALVEVHPTLVQALSEQLGKSPAVQHIAGAQGVRYGPGRTPSANCCRWRMGRLLALLTRMGSRS